MKHHRSLIRYAVLLLALLQLNPAMQAANRKARPAPKERTAKMALPTPQEEFQKHVEQELANLRDDVYTRATWKKLQEVKQESDDTARNTKVVTSSAGAIGFVLGCLVTFFLVKRMGRSEESLKIT
jgi:hypothetical protein